MKFSKSVREEMEGFEKYLKEETFHKVLTRRMETFTIGRFLMLTQLHRKLGKMPEKALEHEMVKGIVAILKKKREDYLLPALRHYLLWKGFEDLALRIPKIPQSHRKKNPPTLTEEDLKRIEENFPNGKWAERFKMVYLIQKMTGARASMVLKLRLQDIKLFDNYAVLLMRGKARRTDKLIKTVIFEKEAVEKLRSYIENYDLNWDYIFLKPPTKSTPLYKKILSAYVSYLSFLKKACAKAGVNIGTHDLRRYFIYKFYEASGHDIEATRKAVGHSNISTTSIYLESYSPNIAQTLKEVQKGLGGGEK